MPAPRLLDRAKAINSNYLTQVATYRMPATEVAANVAKSAYAD